MREKLSEQKMHEELAIEELENRMVLISGISFLCLFLLVLRDLMLEFSCFLLVLA